MKTEYRTKYLKRKISRTKKQRRRKDKPEHTTLCVRKRVPIPVGKAVRSSKKEHKVDALALRADERRDKLR